MNQIVIFTDLDGTLIDHDTYQFKEARATLELLRQRSIPVIICSSKTRAEIEVCRLRMGLETPFIVENGAAVFVPRNILNPTGEGFVEKETYHAVELGIPYGVLCDIWRKTKDQEGFHMIGFSEMTIEEISAHTGLLIEDARLAAMREYSEPFLFSDTPDRFQRLDSLLQEQGLQITKGGRFYHLTGHNDKGKAVEILKKLYAQAYPRRKLITVGLGDSANDIPMLKHVDIPVVIRKKTGEWESIHGVDPVIYSKKPGPSGWAEAIKQILL
jgi:mannosyl-3-phosphoglycerate phosphatase